MLIYVTVVASWSHEHPEIEREKLRARVKLDTARANTLEMEKNYPPTDMTEFNIADVVVEIRAPPVRSDTIGYENEHENDLKEPSWLEQWYGIAKFQKETIGRLDAKLIHRDHFVGSFAEDIDQPSEGAAQMALDLFDRYGRLRPEFLQHPFKKGSGVWGDELSSGDLLLLDKITVDEDYRRQGIATGLAETIIQVCRARSDVFFALVHPGALSAEAIMQIERLCEQTNMDSRKTETEQMYIKKRRTEAEREAFDDLVQDTNTDLEVTATRFWRSVGFRRVGSSSWFALAGDASHPAHTLPPEKDFELPDVAQRGTSAKLYDGDEIQYAQTMRSEDLLTWMSRIFDGLSIHDARWYSTDEKGETVLHTAAQEQNASAVAWILERNSRLRKCRNLKGETPLEALLAALERSRTHRGPASIFAIFASDHFKGYTLKGVECLAMLQNIEPTHAQKLCMRYGCTCSQCIGGYLSPRMRFVLKNFADTLADDLMSNLGDSDAWPHWDIAAKFVPKSTKFKVRELDKLQEKAVALYQRFATLCKSGSTSSSDVTATMLPSAARLFELEASDFRKGRELARAVGSAVFWSAVQRGPIIGNGDFEKCCGDQVEDTSDDESVDGDSVVDGIHHFEDNSDDSMYGGDSEELRGHQLENSSDGEDNHGAYADLPSCRNDLEYGFVGSMLGYARISHHKIEQ